jgi:hypothetical protein
MPKWNAINLKEASNKVNTETTTRQGLSQGQMLLLILLPASKRANFLAKPNLQQRKP